MSNPLRTVEDITIAQANTPTPLSTADSLRAVKVTVQAGDGNLGTGRVGDANISATRGTVLIPGASATVTARGLRNGQDEFLFSSVFVLSSQVGDVFHISSNIDVYTGSEATVRFTSPQEIIIDHTNDSIKVGDGTDFLAVNTDGTIGIGDGVDSLDINTDGSLKIGDGTDTLDINPDGSILVGDGTDLLAINTDGSVKVGDGTNTLALNADGSVAVGDGTEILLINPDGSVKVGDGTDTLDINSDGSVKVGDGTHTVDVNPDGSLKVGDGTDTLGINTDGSIQIGDGTETLLINTDGSIKLGDGVDSLDINSDGSISIGDGTDTLGINTDGSIQIGDGTDTLELNTDGSVNAEAEGFDPAGTKVKVKVSGLDITNSTAIPLGIAGVFTGTFTSVDQYNTVSIVLNSDVSSALDGAVVDFSTDGTVAGITRSLRTTFLVNADGAYVAVPTEAAFYRVTYTNGAIAQAFFRLQTILKDDQSGSAAVPIGSTLTDNTSATITRSVITGKDDFTNFQNVAITRHAALNTALADAQSNAQLLIAPNGSLNTGELTRLVGGNFIDGQPLLTHIWEETFVNGASSSTPDGELVLDTNTTANGEARLRTARMARFITATFNVAHLAVSTPNQANADVIRRWGVFDPSSTSIGSDGVYFENNAGAYSVVRVKSGVVEETVVEASFSEPNPLIKNDNVAVYEIFYNAGTIFFYQNRKILHKMSSLDSAAYATPHLRAGAVVVNINGNTTSNTLVTRGFAISRIGAATAIPDFFTISTATTSVIKNTPGHFHKIVITNKGLGTSNIDIYNNTVGSGELIATIDSSDVNGELNFGVDFDIGLTIVTSGTAIDITVVYD